MISGDMRPALFYTMLFVSTPCVFLSHTLGAVCERASERDGYLADCFVRCANKALRLIPSAAAAPRTHRPKNNGRTGVIGTIQVPAFVAATNQIERPIR